MYRPDKKPVEENYTGIARVLFPEVFMHMCDFQKMERKIVTEKEK
jgi:hypothetical protein